MMTIDKNLVEKAMKESGFTPEIVDQVTRKGFYESVMSQEDPDSKDIYTLYGVLNIKEEKKQRKGMKKGESTVGKYGCMQDINKKKIASMISKKGYTYATFAEACGVRTCSNLSAMLNRGRCKWNVIIAMSKVLGCCPRDIISGDCKAKGVDTIPTSFPNELVKNINEFTIEVDSSRFKKVGNKMSPRKLSEIMNIPVSVVKLAQVSNCKIPISAIQYLCDSGEADLEDILPNVNKDDIPQVSITDSSEPIGMAKNPMYRGEEKCASAETFAEACTRMFNEKKHEKYIEQQHQQESLINANKRSLEMRKNNMVHDGMISIDALIKITNMLSQNPEVQGLFITLAALPDDKRKHAINALNTLITSLQ